MDDIRQLQELEWLYGADAEVQIERNVQLMLARMRATDDKDARRTMLEHFLNEDFHFGSIDTDEVLLHLEGHTDELAALLGNSEDGVFTDLEVERDSLIDRVEQDYPELVAHVRERRDHLDHDFRANHPSSAARIEARRAQLHARIERERAGETSAAPSTPPRIRSGTSSTPPSSSCVMSSSSRCACAVRRRSRSRANSARRRSWPARRSTRPKKAQRHAQHAAERAQKQADHLAEKGAASCRACGCTQPPRPQGLSAGADTKYSMKRKGQLPLPLFAACRRCRRSCAGRSGGFSCRAARSGRTLSW